MLMQNWGLASSLDLEHLPRSTAGTDQGASVSSPDSTSGSSHGGHSISLANKVRSNFFRVPSSAKGLASQMVFGLLGSVSMRQPVSTLYPSYHAGCIAEACNFALNLGSCDQASPRLTHIQPSCLVVS